MEQNIENEMDTGTMQWTMGVRVSQPCGVPTRMIIVHWSLCWGPHIYVNTTKYSGALSEKH